MPITKILVPIDLSAHSLEAAAYAGSLAAGFGSELVFLHVLQNGWPLRAGGTGDPRSDRWSANVAKRFKASLCVIHASKALESTPGLPCAWKCWIKKMTGGDIQEPQEGLGADVNVWLGPGKPLQAIPPLAEQLRADLLVIGESPEKLLFGDLRTLSYEIACRTPCPVASV